uniref:Uncharacterized protein n=1 Tax=Cannabis sativa TaxID=3483 RepID=A0A803PRA8_CANSA
MSSTFSSSFVKGLWKVIRCLSSSLGTVVGMDSTKKKPASDREMESSFKLSRKMKKDEDFTEKFDVQGKFWNTPHGKDNGKELVLPCYGQWEEELVGHRMCLNI